jgi:asparagine N-glycosylation enzyme membrane subunit Stt3
MWTAAFSGFSQVGSMDFWTGVAAYEFILVGLVFVVAFLGSYRKKKSMDVK